MAHDAPPPPPTMRDVARAAGVSPTAVSFVLNERKDGRISAATQAKVLERRPSSASDRT